ncbi:MAG TPA: hypothetical protein VE595_00250 [Nitrososphaeraceae archaeon]|nr:hypothetical protein [Nitrososphaeraceae archaeon]
MMLSTLAKKTSFKNALKWFLGGFSILFIGMLFLMLIYDTLTGASSQTAEYCAKYGFLASPECW